jgi:hypothetical protein
MYRDLLKNLNNFHKDKSWQPTVQWSMQKIYDMTEE